MKPEKRVSFFKENCKHSSSSTLTIEKHTLIKWQSMIAKAKTEKVLNELVDFFMDSNNLKYNLKEIILLSNRWNSLEKDFNDGIITYARYSTLRNRVCKSILSFLEQF